MIPDSGSFNTSNATYTITPMTWDLFVDGVIPTQTFAGTIQELFAFVNTTYPAYVWPIPAGWNGTDKATTTTSSHLATHSESGTLVCDMFTKTWIQYVRDGVKYLYGVPGTPRNDPGPGNCGRVSCESDSGIWWCNDVSLLTFPFHPAQCRLDSLTCCLLNQLTTPKVLSSYSVIGDLANQIAQPKPAGCYVEDDHWFRFVDGQSFHADGWNVIVSELTSGHC